MITSTNLITEYAKRNFKDRGQKLEQAFSVETASTGKASSHING